MTPTRGVVLLFISWLEQLRYILLMFSVSEIEAISFDLYILNVICFFFCIISVRIILPSLRTNFTYGEAIGDMVTRCSLLLHVLR